MKTCRYCEEVIDDQDEICGNCGYNPKTDTLTASFVKKVKKTDFVKNQNKVGSGVRTFMFWGIIVVVFSLGIKYQGKIGDIFWDVKSNFLGKKINKPAPVLGKVNPPRTTRLIDVRSYKAPADKSAGKSKRIEGIFYDPQGKSYVVINGQLVSEQESFGNMLIKKINRNSVEVVEDGNNKILQVYK